jgi:hypothetical protein
MASIVLYKKLSKQEIDKIYKKCLVDVSCWFEKNPRRRVCNIFWIYGKSCRVRKKFIEKDFKKIYNETILESFK